MLVGCTIAVHALVAFLPLALGLHAHAAVPKRRAWFALVSAHRCRRLHALRSSARDQNEFALHVQEPRDARCKQARPRVLRDARCKGAMPERRPAHNSEWTLPANRVESLQTELANPDKII